MKSQAKVEETVLTSIQSKREINSSIQRRSEIILDYSFAEKRKCDIVRSLNIPATTLSKWIKRWKSYESDRSEWYRNYQEGVYSQKEYIDFIKSIFKDKQRPGAPVTFAEETKEKIVALAATDPRSLGLPFSRWSEELLLKELKRRKIVKSISTSHIGRILKKT